MGSPSGAVGDECILERLGPVRIGVEGNLPLLPLVFGEEPAAAVGVGDGLLALGALFGGELRGERGASLGSDVGEGGVEGGKALGE